MTSLPQEISLAVFRITQEALTNVRKHAHCSEVRVSLHLDQHELGLYIEDDGRGFDLYQGPGPLHFGLVGMHEWASQLGGTLKMDSHPGQGTRVRVRIPVHE